MRTALLTFLLIASPVAADDAAAVVARAIEAHGGADNLAKRKAEVQSSQGKVFASTGEMEGSREFLLDYPNHGRLDFVLRSRASNGGMTFGTEDGKTGWMRENECVARDMKAAEMEQFSDLVYATWLSTLKPLKDPGFTLAIDKEENVNGQQAQSVIVKSKGKPDVTLYFEKEHGHLVKLVYRDADAGFLVKRETEFSDFKKVDGVKVPTHQIDSIDGRKFGDWTVSYKFEEKMAADKFKKP